MTLNPAAGVPSNAAIGRRLRESRKHNGLTLLQLSERAGVHLNTLSGIETGRTTAKKDTLLKICAALGVTAEQIEGKAVPSAPDDSSVGVFLEQYLTRVQESLGWPSNELGGLMRSRFLATGIRLGIVKEEAAHYFAKQITKQFNFVSQLLELFDHDAADIAVAAISQEHCKLRQKIALDSYEEHRENIAPPPTAKTLQMLIQRFQSGH